MRAVFLRDDDVWEADAVFKELCEVFLRYRVPVVYGVVPALIEAPFVRFMKRWGRKALFDIVQHGWDHQDHSGGGREKYEFGACRSYDIQHQDMARGRQVLKKAFGPLVVPAFVPPFHGADRATLKAVRDLKYRIFSAGERLFPAHSAVLDFPAGTALNDYAADGAPVPLDERAMLRRLQRGFFCTHKVAGFVYHHRVIRTRKEIKAMALFVAALARLRDRGEIRLVRFSDLLRPGKG